MTSSELDTLRAQRSAMAQQLAQGLAAQAPLADLQALSARLSLVDGVLAGVLAAVVANAPAKPRSPAWHRHAMAALVVAALVSVVALVPMPRVSFSLEIQAGAAQLQMASAGSLAGQVLAGELRVEGFDKLESADPVWVRRAAESGSGQLSLQAQRLSLRRISFPAGARLDFEAGTPAVRLGVDGQPHATELELGGQVSSRFAGAPMLQSQIDAVEWLRFESTAAATELWLATAPQRSYAWRGLRPGALRFIERQAGSDGQVRLVSALRQATLRLPATGQELRLAPGSGLALDGLQIEQSELQLGEQLTLTLNGSADGLVVDTGGFQQSLKPSLLEYAAHHHRLSLLWSTAGLLWGISLWLRKTFGEAV